MVFRQRGRGSSGAALPARGAACAAPSSATPPRLAHGRVFDGNAHRHAGQQVDVEVATKSASLGLRAVAGQHEQVAHGVDAQDCLGRPRRRRMLAISAAM
jgi:hypothetical protein